MSEHELVARARRFAEQAHGAIGHRRKYSGNPYSEHLQRVAQTVQRAGGSAEAIAAAWLHDVVEDTPTTLQQVENEFGAEVARLVQALTDAPGEQGNRAARKQIDRARLAQAPAEAKTVKLADLIDNAEDIAINDPHFARVYLREMGALLAVLGDGDATLYAEAVTLHQRLDAASRSRSAGRSTQRGHHPADKHDRRQRND